MLHTELTSSSDPPDTSVRLSRKSSTSHVRPVTHVAGVGGNKKDGVGHLDKESGNDG